MATEFIGRGRQLKHDIAELEVLWTRSCDHHVRSHDPAAPEVKVGADHVPSSLSSSQYLSPSLCEFPSLLSSSLPPLCVCCLQPVGGYESIQVIRTHGTKPGKLQRTPINHNFHLSLCHW